MFFQRDRERKEFQMRASKYCKFNRMKNLIVAITNELHCMAKIKLIYLVEEFIKISFVINVTSIHSYS